MASFTLPPIILTSFTYLLALIIIIVSIVLLCIISSLVIHASRVAKAPPGLPWIGLQGKKILPRLRATIREMTAGRKPIQEAYDKYGKHGKACIFPSLVFGCEVILPPSDAGWLGSQRDSELGATVTAAEFLGFAYFMKEASMASIIDFAVLRRDLARQGTRMVPALLQEIEVAITKSFGIGTTEWKDVQLVKVMQADLGQIVNRAFVGLPLCRDQAYLRSLLRWEMTFAICAMSIRQLVPEPCRPFVGHALAGPVYLLKYLAMRRVLPEVRRRLAEQAAAKPDSATDRPIDMIQLLIDNATHKADPVELRPEYIASKQMLISMFATHTTTLTLPQVLVAILCHPDATNLLAALREEAAAVLPLLPSDPSAIRALPKLDSVIRESMRHNAMMGHGMQREVLAPEGLTAPSGTYLPRGCYASLPVEPMQRDAELCESGDEFRPLRFYEAGNESPEHRQKTAVHVGEQFLSFGLGRHACPGRFFAVQTMKLVLGYLLVHYDVEPLAEKPKTTCIGEGIVLSAKTTIKVRRRTDAGQPEKGGLELESPL